MGVPRRLQWQVWRAATAQSLFEELAQNCDYDDPTHVFDLSDNSPDAELIPVDPEKGVGQHVEWLRQTDTYTLLDLALWAVVGITNADVGSPTYWQLVTTYKACIFRVSYERDLPPLVWSEFARELLEALDRPNSVALFFDHVFDGRELALLGRHDADLYLRLMLNHLRHSARAIRLNEARYLIHSGGRLFVTECIQMAFRALDKSNGSERSQWETFLRTLTWGDTGLAIVNIGLSILSFVTEETAAFIMTLTIRQPYDPFIADSPQ